MKFIIKPIDIISGKNEVILNEDDATKMGLRTHDRLKINQKTTQTVGMVEITKSLVSVGELGIYQDLLEKFPFDLDIEVEVITVGRPESFYYIKEKMKGKKLAKEEVYSIVADAVAGNLSNLELAAFILAEEFLGLDGEEIEYLTRAMAETGQIIDFEEPVFDKHSIGGVPGNKVTLLIVPIIASAGLLIPKTSSRAITSPAGTADTFEVLAEVKFTIDELKELAKKVRGTIVWGGALNLAPSDDIFIHKVEHGLGIDPLPQMMASIFSKKLATGVDFLVLDIPTLTRYYERGAKVGSVDEATTLARKFVELSDRIGITTEAAITYAGQPVGHAIGPALEAREALQALEGLRPSASLIEKSCALAGVLLEMSGKAAKGQGKNLADEILRSGKALEKMKEIIEAQGGTSSVTSQDIAVGNYKAMLYADCDGYITHVDNEKIVKICNIAGTPRDKQAGMLLKAKVGYKVTSGDVLFEIYSSSETRLSKALAFASKNNPIVCEGMLIKRVSELA
ncbi:MAG: AMP phosphorylase [Promethearchaeota archaeon]